MKKFNMNSLQISLPHLSDVVTSLWEIHKSYFFSIVIHILQIIYISSEENK